MNDEDSQKGHDINIRIWRKGGLERQIGSNLINNSILFSNGGKGGGGKDHLHYVFMGRREDYLKIFRWSSNHLSNPPQHVVFFRWGGGSHLPFFHKGGGTTTSVFLALFHSAIRGGPPPHASEQFLPQQST